jgi:hypothetical protein
MNEKYRSDCSQRLESIAAVTNSISVCSLVIRWFRVFQAGQVEFGCNNVQTDETNFGFKMRFEI